MVGKGSMRLKIQRLDFWQYILEGGEPCWEGKFEIWREKAKIGYLWTQLDFIEGLVEFIEVLIARKIDF